MQPNSIVHSWRIGVLIAVVITGLSPLQAFSAAISIATLDDLQLVGSGGAYPLNGDYILAADIDAAATGGWNAGAGFAPIGSLASPFTGTFNGQGHSITGLVINRPAADVVGLFGHCGSGAILSEVAIVDANVTGGKEGAGALAGWIRGGEVIGCFASGSVTSGRNDALVGGLVGWLDESDCTLSLFDGTVSGIGSAVWVGGLVGYNSSGYISRCFSRGSVTSNGSSSQAGGLAAQLNNRYESPRVGRIDKSFSTATVQALGAGPWGGGLVAVVGRFTIIEQCWAGGAVTSENQGGGLIAEAQIRIYDCFARGPVTGGTFSSGVGGFAALFTQYIGGADRCYATGFVTPVGASTWKGGFAAFPATADLVEHSFWDTQTTGQATSGANTGTGLTTAEMQSKATYQNAGWSIANGATEGFVWAILPGDYPYLPAAQPIGLSGGFSLTPGGGNAVGSLEGLGPARGDWSFELAPGPGDADNDKFQITGQTLEAIDAASLATGDYSVHVGGNPPATMGAAAVMMKNNAADSLITTSDDGLTSAIFVFESSFTITMLPSPNGHSDGWVSY